MFYIFPKEVFPLFREMELSSPRIKKLLIFQEGNFQARKIKKKKNSKTISYIFSKKNFFLYFGKQNFLAPSLKIPIYFLKKTFLYIKRELAKPEKQKKSTLKKLFIFLHKKLSSHFGMTSWNQSQNQFLEPITETFRKFHGYIWFT